jgi:hypothetical protein
MYDNWKVPTPEQLKMERKMRVLYWLKILAYSLANSVFLYVLIFEVDSWGSGMLMVVFTFFTVFIAINDVWNDDTVDALIAKIFLSIVIVLLGLVVQVFRNKPQYKTIEVTGVLTNPSCYKYELDCPNCKCYKYDKEWELVTDDAKVYTVKTPNKFNHIFKVGYRGTFEITIKVKTNEEDSNN